MVLSAYLGINPKTELQKLEAFMKNGTICNLVLGDQLFGTWVVKSIPYNVEYVYKEGDIIQAKVSVTLMEAGVDV
jgi:phage protein U